MTTDYIPILPTKAGELSALSDLPAEVKAGFAPLFVIHPIPFDFETRRPSKTAAQHVSGLGRKIATAWGTHPAFLDPIFLSDEPIPDDAQDPVQTVIDDAACAGLHLVPVIRPGQCPGHTTVAAKAHQDTGVGTCVRLSPRHWPTNPSRAQVLDELLASGGVGPVDADLVLDLGVEVHSELAAKLASVVLQSLPHAEAWRSLTLAGGSFPENLSQIQKDQLTRLTRLDWKVTPAMATLSGEPTSGSPAQRGLRGRTPATLGGGYSRRSCAARCLPSKWSRSSVVAISRFERMCTRSVTQARWQSNGATLIVPDTAARPPGATCTPLTCGRAMNHRAVVWFDLPLSRAVQTPGGSSGWWPA